jgi:hypothetical protein
MSTEHEQAVICHVTSCITDVAVKLTRQKSFQQTTIIML